MCCSFPDNAGVFKWVEYSNFCSVAERQYPGEHENLLPTCANNLVDPQVKNLRFHGFVDTGSGTQRQFEDLISCLCLQFVGDSRTLEAPSGCQRRYRIYHHFILLRRKYYVFGPTHEMCFLSSDYLKR